MSVIDKQEQKLEAAKEKLKHQERLLKLRKQKEESKSLYQVGRMAKKASILEIDQEALLGAFFEIAEKSTDSEQIKKWKAKASATSNDSDSETLDAIIVKFDGELAEEAKPVIKNLSLKWNRFRKEWYGYASLNEAKSQLEKFGAKVESV